MACEPSFEDTRDYDDVSRGFLGALVPGTIKGENGKVVWNADEYAFVNDACPPTANPKLWRQAQLNSKQGLFEVCPGIYQTRALDLSNMTIVEGEKGIIIIDPLISCECAAASLRLYQQYRGDHRPVTGMIYSHSHGDHYMGARGVLSQQSEHSIPIVAPEGFMESIVSESVLAGPAMRRRAAFMYGNALPRSPTGQIGVGIGMGSSTGSTSLIPPTVLIQKTGEELVIDGVRIVFQMIPGAEAPAEINLYFPDFKALCVPETATNCMHNIVTLRGAQVRDSKAWSTYLDEAIMLFGSDSEVIFGSHNWPTWGQKELINRLAEQRDMYGYLHDQTVRLMNLGMTGIEIAEKLTLPPAISSAWHCQGFYGSLSHNVKGIYQKYMTWFDGHPAHLWQYPPAEEGKRYVACMGGIDSLCDKAEKFINDGDQRFAATLLFHAVAAEPGHTRATQLLASSYEKLGFGAENTTWRNFYLTGAQQLRTGAGAGMVAGGKTQLGSHLTIAQSFEVLGVQLDGERAVGKSFNVRFDVIDLKERWNLILSNCVLTGRRIPAMAGQDDLDDTDLHLKITKSDLLEVLRGNFESIKGGSHNLEALRVLVDLTSVPQGSSRGPAQL